MPEIGKIWIKVTPDLKEFWEKVHAAVKAASDEDVKVKLQLDSDGFREKVRAETEGMKAEVKVKAKVDQTDFAKALAEVKAAAKAADMKLDVNFRDKEAEAHLVGLIARLKAIARLNKIDLRIGTEHRGEVGGAASLLGRGVSGAADIGSSLASGAGSLFAAMKDNTVMILVAGLALLAPALALVAQAVVGLPALISAVALPIGVFALGLGGIKKALDDSGILSDIMGKGKNAKEKQGLGKSIKEVQQNVSDVFQKGLTPVFRQIGGVIPQLLRGLPFVAQGLVNLAQSVTKAVITPEFVANFDRFTNSVSAMLTNMGPGLGQFASGMMRLVTDVGDHLPGLGKWIGDLGTRFNTWISSMDKPQNWWGKDIPNSSPLDKMITNIKPTLDGIVTFVSQLVTAGAKLAQDPQMATKIKDTLEGISKFVTKTLPDLSSAFKTLADAAKALGMIPDKPDVPKPGDHGYKPPALTHAQAAQHPGHDEQTGKYSPDLKGTLAFLKDFLTGESGKAQGKPDSILSYIKHGLGWFGHNDVGPVGPSGTAHADTGDGTGALNAGPKATGALAPHAAAAVGGADGGAAAAGKVSEQMKGVESAVKSATTAISGASKGAFDSLVAECTQAVAKCIAAINTLGPQITSSLKAAASSAHAAGAAIGQQMAAGIASGEGAAVAAAHHLADAVKGAMPRSPAKTGPFSGSGWADVKDSGSAISSQLAAGIRESAADPVGEAHSMAQRLADAVASGKIDPDLLDQAKSDMQALGDLSKNLSTQGEGLKGKENKAAREGLKAQREAIKQVREELKLQQERARELAKTEPKQKKQVDMNEQLGTTLSNMVSTGANFATANMHQFESDLGIGGGAITSIADQMIGWGTQSLGGLLSGMVGGKGKGDSVGGDTHIHVNSVEEGLQAARHEQARKQLTHTGGGMGR